MAPVKIPTPLQRWFARLLGYGVIVVTFPIYQPGSLGGLRKGDWTVVEFVDLTLSVLRLSLRRKRCTSVHRTPFQCRRQSLQFLQRRRDFDYVYYYLDWSPQRYSLIYYIVFISCVVFYVFCGRSNNNNDGFWGTSRLNIR